MSRNRNTDQRGGSWTEAEKRAVWQRGTIIPGKNSDVERNDACGIRIVWDNHGLEVSTGWEIDHIKPVAKGGDDTPNNLQPLQWENNRYKSSDWPNWLCKYGSK